MSYLYFAGGVTKMNARFRDNTVAEADSWRAAVKTSPVRRWHGKKRRLPATEVSSASLLPRASKASRNSLKSLETRAGWSFLVGARRRCGVAGHAEQADR